MSREWIWLILYNIPVSWFILVFDYRDTHVTENQQNNSTKTGAGKGCFEPYKGRLIKFYNFSTSLSLTTLSKYSFGYYRLYTIGFPICSTLFLYINAPSDYFLQIVFFSFSECLLWHRDRLCFTVRVVWYDPILEINIFSTQISAFLMDFWTFDWQNLLCWHLPLMTGHLSYKAWRAWNHRVVP